MMPLANGYYAAEMDSGEYWIFRKDDGFEMVHARANNEDEARSWAVRHRYDSSTCPPCDKVEVSS